jgi:transmembrane 9 superfamily protein 2/4
MCLFFFKAVAVLGFLSPSSRGALSTVTLILYVCFAGVAGYTSARIYKMMQGEYWRRNVFVTATLIPG